MQNKKNRGKNYLILHLLLILYSLGGISSKLAAEQELGSWKWMGLYGIVLGNLGIYAIGWQQILKKLPLVDAYANKAVTVIWGMIWGYLFFSEPITIGKAVGSIVLVLGVYLVVSGEEK